MESKEEPKPEPKPEEKKVEPEAKEEIKKKEPKKKEKKPVKKVEEIPEVSQLDMRVGKIVKIQKHPDSVKLYIEEVDVGNGEIRKVASGLQEFVPIEQLENCFVVMLCNLKEKKLAGYPSHGMVLCASSADGKVIEPLVPPEGSAIGDPVIAEGFERKPAPDINLSKKNNPWNKVQPQLTTGPDLIATYNGKQLKTEKGPVKSKTLVAAHISQTNCAYLLFFPLPIKLSLLEL
eukprot:TRINITY_DN1304_c0_g1_i1.p9 TRINITY_DN1304_c0_g1~~TRINITY_DN1304_c0_g1_i1.p9  ORF type:complete len:233 (-),score=41.65 TRINITY_DN1304_c0_g1_i1:6526-7224(-)